MFVRGAAILTSILTGLALILAAALCALPDRLTFDGATEYTFFTGHTSFDCRTVTADAKSAPLVRLTLRDVCGESATFEEFDVESYLSSVNGEVLFTEELSDSVNYYCSADLPYSVRLYGRTVNLHICVREDRTIVASPIIFGGY